MTLVCCHHLTIYFLFLTNLEAKLQVLLNDHDHLAIGIDENHKITEKVSEFILDINTILLLTFVFQSFKQNKIVFSRPAACPLGLTLSIFVENTGEGVVKRF
jgi:hypothetical protein